LASGGFAPNQLATAYGLRPLHRRGIDGRGMRIAFLEGNAFHPADVGRFARCFGLPAPRLRLLQAVPGEPPPALAGEPGLDLDVGMTVAPHAAFDVYQIGIDHLADFPRLFAAPLDPRRNGGHPPDVIERSYGGCEPAWRQSAPDALALMQHVLMVAVAHGITVVASAGDRGSTDCQTNGNVGDPVPELATRYPATSPYVTGVGGTALALDHANRIVQQPAWNDAPLGELRGGGGGQSALFARPAWQSARGVPGGHRAVPDVSFLADMNVGYAFYCSVGCPTTGWHRSGGTSAGAPLMAAGLALVDEARRRVHQPRLGNVDPLLYRLARARGARRIFHDVLRGTNDVLGVGCCTARRGYDLATGLGSVDFAALAAAAIS
jgi:subtilase family serine protease